MEQIGFSLQRRECAGQSWAEAVHGALQSQLQVQFDLARNVVCAVHVQHEGRGLLIVNAHHIAMDGWSIRVFWSEFDQAYAALNRALELDPRYAEAFFDRGDLLRREGYLAEATADLTTAIELAPNMAAAWNARGSAWANLDDDKRALSDFMCRFAAAWP